MSLFAFGKINTTI